MMNLGGTAGDLFLVLRYFWDEIFYAPGGVF